MILNLNFRLFFYVLYRFTGLFFCLLRCFVIRYIGKPRLFILFSVRKREKNLHTQNKRFTIENGPI